MKTHPLLLGFLAACFLTSGCASIMSGPNQTVAVRSTPEGAKATFYDEKQIAVASGVTPFIVTLKRRNDYLLKVEKDQCASFQTNVTGSVNRWYFGNLLFGGVLGFLIIDPATGAMWDLAPDEIAIQMASLESGKSSVMVNANKLKIPERRSGAMTPAEHRELQNNWSNFDRRKAGVREE